VNRVVGVIGSVAIGAAVLGVAAVVLHSAPTTPPTLVATLTNSAVSIPGVQKTASLHLSTYPDSGAITWRRTGNGVGPHPDWVSYGPTTVLQLPAHALITVTIDQYDSGATIPNPFLAQVHGTVGGTETIDGKVVKGISPDAVGHTFTIHNFPSTKQDTLFVSVPLPALPDDAVPAAGSDYPKPHVVTFQFTTGSTGTYAWNCEFPCGDNYASFGGAMSSYGYMSGTIHVV
jgi:hypothetical protein